MNNRMNNDGSYGGYGSNSGYYGSQDQSYGHNQGSNYGPQRGAYGYNQTQQDSYSQNAGYYNNGQYGQRADQYESKVASSTKIPSLLSDFPNSSSKNREMGRKSWGTEQFTNQGSNSWQGMENDYNSRDSYSSDHSQPKNGSFIETVKNNPKDSKLGTPGSGEIKEKSYLEKFMFEWEKVLSEDFERLRAEADREIQGQKEKSGDLGSEFNDDRLNQMVKKKNDPHAEYISVIQKIVTYDVLHLKCQVCNISVYGKKNLDTHLDGKRHLISMADYSVSAPLAPRPSPTLSSSVVSQLVKRYRSAALVGLEYVAEVLVDRADVEYHCLLCDTSSTPNNLMYHLLSVKHRLKYLNIYFKVVGKKFGRVRNVDFWEESSLDLLDTVTSRIEEKYGRGEPTVVASPTIFHNQIAKIRQQMKDARHIRESIDFNFKTLPDPFGTYLYKIPNDQITK